MIVNLNRLGFHSSRHEQAELLLERLVRDGEIQGAAWCVGNRRGAAPPRVLGVAPECLFPVASLTKPVTAAAVMLLIQRGMLTLDDRVADYIPGFETNGKGDIRVRHLLTHTSGLPDQLPENRALRTRHAGLDAFLEGTLESTPMFPPGTEVRYQSMGFLVLGELVQGLTGASLPDFLRLNLFEPLGMHATYLGCPASELHRVAPIQPAADQANPQWGWNSPYWLQLGAPWGGLITSAGDYARFCRMMLDEGCGDRGPLLAPSVIRAMTSNQLARMPEVLPSDRHSRPWGLGWQLAGSGHPVGLGDLLCPLAYGHTGATGSLCWIDPVQEAFFVLLTTRPLDAPGHHLVRISNTMAAALDGSGVD